LWNLAGAIAMQVSAHLTGYYANNFRILCIDFKEYTIGILKVLGFFTAVIWPKSLMVWGVTILPVRNMMRKKLTERPIYP